VAEIKAYSPSIFTYSRRITQQVKIGDLMLGSDYPIRVQSMTTIDTMDTHGSVEQSIRMIESGCELVRITAPSVKEAQNLENIKKELRARGYTTPLVADIHFTPNAAELAARIVEKVRINPGNYADKKRFEHIEYTDVSYATELERIRERFIPLIKICKEYGTAMRIGTNHGSLSDRILSRYGDTPLGMVESALEFLKICEDEHYHNIVLSMKSSNPQVMVQAYRLLVQRMNEDGLKPYPLHLGVTEAGEGEDGRIKSAMGIGSLLQEGIGDTVRVSLTEDPEFEAPVARILVDKIEKAAKQTNLIEKNLFFDPYSYQKKKTEEVFNIGGTNVPRVIADLSKSGPVEIEHLKNIGYFYLPLTDKWRSTDLAADFVYTGKTPMSFMPPNGLREIQDAEVWIRNQTSEYAFPLFKLFDLKPATIFSKVLNFLLIDLNKITQVEMSTLSGLKNWVIILNDSEKGTNTYLALRSAFEILKGLQIPVILSKAYSGYTEEQIQLNAATDLGGPLLDGFGDGVFLQADTNLQKSTNSISFGILQAARCRITKTEYISCPSCGRTLFDLQETTAMIRKRTDHLKGIKIGIMGCIVNGPGEMADADYGYVGIGKDKISLYRGQNVVNRSVPSEDAVNKLIDLIKEDGKWLEPENIEVEASV
jgi:(E)-4-hydroxy-3-methylbut-2-enyl-diphosphate synthase